MTSLTGNISTRTGAIKLSMIVVICLIILKVAVSIISNSISIFAQATDSFLDIISIVITFIALKLSVAPADEGHPFGHGKAEGFAAIIQALFILGAGSFIVYSAIQRIIHSTTIEPDEGIVVMVFSIIASFFLSRHLYKVARTTDSIAVDSLARNIRADVYSAAGVLSGLIIVRLTNIVILDPIIALIMAGFVFKAGYEVIVKAVHELTDYVLPQEEMEIIYNSLKEHNTQIVDSHAIRSRHSGSEHFIDFHIVVPRDWSIQRTHNMCDHLEHDLKEKIINANVIIHPEPCHTGDCINCTITVCDIRDK